MTAIDSCKVFAAALAISVVSAGASLAAPCSAGAVGKIVQNSTGFLPTCEAGTTNNDFLGGTPADYQVNKDSMFDFSDWLFAGKEDLDTGYVNGDVDVDFSMSLGALSGTWDFIDELFEMYTHVMIVMKGGQGNNSQDEYAGYLLDPKLDPDGSYSTPFFTTRGSPTAKNISHMSAYVRGEVPPPPPPPPIPLPAAGLLLLTAMGGVAVLGRRKATA